MDARRLGRFGPRAVGVRERGGETGELERGRRRVEEERLVLRRLREPLLEDGERLLGLLLREERAERDVRRDPGGSGGDREAPALRRVLRAPGGRETLRLVRVSARGFGRLLLRACARRAEERRGRQERGPERTGAKAHLRTILRSARRTRAPAPARECRRGSRSASGR